MHFNFRRTTSLDPGKSPRWLFPVFLIVLLTSSGNCQDHLFPLNEAGEIEYKVEIKNDSVPFSIKWQNGIELMDSLKIPDVPDVNPDVNMLENTIKKKYGFYLMHKPGLMKQILARVDADISLKIGKKESNIIIDNIYIVEYERSRDARYKPKNSKKYYLNKQIVKKKGKYDDYYSIIDEKYQKKAKKISDKLVKY